MDDRDGTIYKIIHKYEFIDKLSFIFETVLLCLYTLLFFPAMCLIVSRFRSIYTSTPLCNEYFVQAFSFYLFFSNWRLQYVFLLPIAVR